MYVNGKHTERRGLVTGHETREDVRHGLHWLWHPSLELGTTDHSRHVRERVFHAAVRPGTRSSRFRGAHLSPRQRYYQNRVETREGYDQTDHMPPKHLV